MENLQDETTQEVSEKFNRLSHAQEFRQAVKRVEASGTKVPDEVKPKLAEKIVISL